MILKLHCYPAKVSELKRTNSTDIDDFHFFTQSILEGLKAELPLYLSKADGVLS